jgi:hypothetical protein
VHFTAVCERHGPFGMGMREGPPMECSPGEHPKRNVVSGMRRCKAADTPTNERDCEISRRELSFQMLC